jgi:hypothetical protein
LEGEKTLDQERDPIPLDDDQDELRLSRPEMAKRITVRTGIGVLAFGLIITLYGASQLAGGAPVYGSYAGVFHQVGLVIMFLGTITLLIGYRIPWFVDLMAVRKPRDNQSISDESTTINLAETSDMAAVQPEMSTPVDTGRSWNQEPWTANLVMFGILVALFSCSTVLVLLLPRAYTALPIIMVNALAFLIGLIGLVYGSSFQRTFCIGAMITLGLLFAQWWLLFLTSFSAGGIGRGAYNTTLMDYFSAASRLLGRAASASLVYTIIMWAAALFFGVAAVGFRFLLEAINHANMRRRS